MQNDIRRKPEGVLFRTYLAAAGIAPESISKPLIGVVTVSTQVLSERPDARELGNAVISGVENAGGIAVRWDSVRTPDLMAWGHADSYSFAWRDQLADFIESWAHQEAVDALVLVGDAHKTLAGMAMAAARLNLPAIVVTAGASRWEYRPEADGQASGKKKTAIAGDPFELLSDRLFGKGKAEGNGNGHAFTECLLAQDNHASHAMDIALEALGVTLPGMATAQPKSSQRQDLAFGSGQKIVSLAQAGHGFRRILTPNAFTNAIRVNAALGGSVDVAVHLIALSHEAGINVTLDQFDKIARETPQVARLGGVGEKDAHRIEDLERAGGVWAIMHALKDKVAPTTTVNGKGAAELAKNAQVRDPQVISGNRPLAKTAGIAVLKGNLAPKGALCLLNQVLPALSQAKGPAAVFEDEQEAARAIQTGTVKKGSILVVRGQGPRGGPGLRKLRILPALLASRGLSKTMPLLTDGRLPDTPAGLFISAISPEGMIPGPLAVLKNGDMIEVDVAARQIGVRLTDMEIRIRQSRWQMPEGRVKKGFLARYSRQVSEAHEGAILK